MQTKTDEPKLAYGVRELAELLGVSHLTLREAIRRGDIKSCRIGRRIIIPRAAVDNWLGGARENAAP